MRILLDECLPVDSRRSFPEHEADTAKWAGLKVKDNGELLRAAELDGYDVQLTVDQCIFQRQQQGGRLSIVLIRARSNKLEDLLPLVDAISEGVRRIKPGEVVRIPEPA
jgi:hypothetical protein